MSESSQIKKEDLEKFIEKLSKRADPYQCFNCGKDFHVSHSDTKCDECYFAQFPKEQVIEFYKTFLS